MEMEDEGGHEHAEEEHPQQEADFPSFSIGRYITLQSRLCSVSTGICGVSGVVEGECGRHPVHEHTIALQCRW